MKGPFAHLAVILTILALIGGALAQGLAQAQPRASDLLTVELCADGEMVEVLVDFRGRPVAPDDCARSFCPDCIPVPPLATAGAGEPAATQILKPLALTPSARPGPTGRPFAVPLARGPPDLT